MARKKKATRASPRKPFDPSGASPSASASGDARTETPRSSSPHAATGVFGSGSRRNALCILALGLLVAVSYFPATQAGFVWDDVIFTEAAPIRDASGLWQIWFSPRDIKREGHYWPLVYTTFWLEHKLWGLAPAGYHIVNVLLHFVNVLLVWRLLLHLAVPGAWAVAAVFAVHPLHVESVAWVIERKDLLSGLFYLSAVLTWLRFVEAPQWGRYVLTLALFVAGLLSKSIVVTLPAALLIGQWWKQGRVTSTDLWHLAPFFLVALAITVADVAFYRTIEVLSLDYSLIERVLIAARALWFYAGKLLWPTELAVIYPLWDIRIGDALAWAYVVAAIAVAALLWFGRDRLGRGPLASALFFVVTLSPVLGFVDYGYMQFSFIADRFQYLAGLGVMAVFVSGAAQGASKLSGVLKMGVTGLLVVVLALLGAMTWHQVGIYRDEITFFNHIIAHNPEARSAHLNLGKALHNTGRLEEAVTAARIAVELRTDSVDAHFNAGLALMELNRFNEALEYYRRAAQLDPRHFEASFHTASTLMELNRFDEAVEYFQAASKIKPQHPAPLQNMAELHRQQGRYEEALEWYAAVLKIDPEYALAHAGKGTTLFHMQRYDEAVQSLERAVSPQPDSPMARAPLLFMARAFEALGRAEAAAEHYERALRIDSRFPETLARLAALRFGQDRYEEALDLYRTLVEIQPDKATAHADIGATLFYLDRPDDALQSFERALSLDPTLESARIGLEQVRAVLR